MRSIFSGILISLGGLGYLALGGIPGAIIFTFGLVAIITLDIPLYTGVAGTIDLNPKFIKIGLKELSGVLLGNLFGCFIVSLLSWGTNSDSSSLAQLLVFERLTSGLFNIISRAILCGIIIDTTVFLYKKQKSIIPILFGVPLFILIGGIHSIADAFYIIYGKVFEWKILLVYPLIIIGNFIGCNIRRIFV